MQQPIFEVEGTWEEILAYSAQLSGRRVRLTVLPSESKESTWQEALQRALEVGERIRARRGGDPLPDPAEIIRQIREERSAQLDHLR
ncbi:hypothetical protein HRbin15_01891 [bacterium HR15]|nr:hypothetical protein HRbin15_01891 [bacterium HR15]